jgi:hypothetical protein
VWRAAGYVEKRYIGKIPLHQKGKAWARKSGARMFIRVCLGKPVLGATVFAIGLVIQKPLCSCKSFFCFEFSKLILPEVDYPSRDDN